MDHPYRSLPQRPIAPPRRVVVDIHPAEWNPTNVQLVELVKGRLKGVVVADVAASPLPDGKLSTKLLAELLALPLSFVEHVLGKPDDDPWMLIAKRLFENADAQVMLERARHILYLLQLLLRD